MTTPNALPPEPRSRSELETDLITMVGEDRELAGRCYALIGAWIVAGASVESAMALTLRVIAEGLTEAALAGVTT